MRSVTKDSLFRINRRAERLMVAALHWDMNGRWQTTYRPYKPTALNKLLVSNSLNILSICQVSFITTEKSEFSFAVGRLRLHHEQCNILSRL